MTTEKQELKCEAVFQLINNVEKFGGHEIALFIVEDKPWFKGNDIARILGYVNAKKAVLDHVDFEDKQPLGHLIKVVPFQSGFNIHNKNDLKSTYINESGLYSLILSSKLPAAKAFKRWVTSDLLPRISRIGRDKYIKELEDCKTKLAQIERERLALNDYVRSYELLRKDQIFYLATTPAYAARNRFEFGGVKSAKDLRSRLSSYNTGRPEGDLYYYTKIFECNKYEQIEERIHLVLRNFKDKANSRKEMVHLRYNLFVEVVNFICDNFDREVEFINARCQQFLESSIKEEPIVPEPIDLGYYIEISVSKNGVRQETRVDVSKWTEEQIHAKLEEIIELCALEKKKVPYNLRSQKDSFDMELAWTSLTPYFKKLHGLSLMEWRGQYRTWYKKVQPRRLIIKGVKI